MRSARTRRGAGSPGSASAAASASPSAATSPTGTTRPRPPSTSGGPPQSVATTGSPCARASATVRPKLSLADVTARQAARQYQDAGSATWPGRTTRSARPSRASVPAMRPRSGPSPRIASRACAGAAAAKASTRSGKRFTGSSRPIARTSGGSSGIQPPDPASNGRGLWIRTMRSRRAPQVAAMSSSRVSLTQTVRAANLVVAGLNR